MLLLQLFLLIVIVGSLSIWLDRRFFRRAE